MIDEEELVNEMMIGGGEMIDNENENEMMIGGGEMIDNEDGNIDKVEDEEDKKEDDFIIVNDKAKIVLTTLLFIRDLPVIHFIAT